MDDHIVRADAGELTALVEEIVAAGGTAVMDSRGTSMRPMLTFDQSRVRLAKPQTLRRGDVALYRYPNGKCLLHRIVRVERDGSLTIRGDNNLQTERGVRPEWVVAVVTDFTRRGRWVSCGSLGYRLYWRTWLLVWPLRRLAVRAYGRLRGR